MYRKEYLIAAVTLVSSLVLLAGCEGPEGPRGPAGATGIFPVYVVGQINFDCSYYGEKG
jgi:hypothetical protein